MSFKERAKKLAKEEYDGACSDLEQWESFKADFLETVGSFLHDESKMRLPRVFIDEKIIETMSSYLHEIYDDVFFDQKKRIVSEMKDYEAKQDWEYRDQVKADYYHQQMGD